MCRKTPQNRPRGGAWEYLYSYTECLVRGLGKAFLREKRISKIIAESWEWSSGQTHPRCHEAVKHERSCHVAPCCRVPHLELSAKGVLAESFVMPVQLVWFSANWSLYWIPEFAEFCSRQKVCWPWARKMDLNKTVELGCDRFSNSGGTDGSLRQNVCDSSLHPVCFFQWKCVHEIVQNFHSSIVSDSSIHRKRFFSLEVCARDRT